MVVRFRFLTCVLALLPAARGLAAGPSSPPVPQAGVRAAVEVTAMDLDVVATKDGRAVNDLAREEFVVRVDGKPVPIDYFTRIEAGTVHGPDLATASPDLVLDTLKADSGETYVPRQFLVYFDDDRLLPPQRVAVIEGLRDFVTRLSPSDRASIVSYTGATRVLVPFTNSKETLLDGLSRLEKASPAGLMWESQYQQTVRELRVARPYTRDGILRNWQVQAATRERSALAELARSVSALAARSGKRTLLLVTNGYEWFPGQTLTQAYGTSLNSQFEENIGDDIGKVLARANSSGITIQVFDAKGLSSDSDASQMLPAGVNPFFKAQNFRDSMAALAADTGGSLVENRNVFRADLDRVYREASSYYSVGVTLNGVPGRGSRKVEVRSTRPGVAVRARTGFGAKTADEAAVDRVEMALLTPGATGDFAATLRIGALEKKGGIGRRTAPWDVAFPISELTFREEGGFMKAAAEVTLSAAEDTGARSSIKPEKVSVSIPVADWEKAKGQAFVHRGQLTTGKGNIRFVAAVRDVASGRMALASFDLRVE
ncbi:MAG: VWA domain-containing protein [Holophagales bacterium]|jgi:VWFA-related protein|nr:VWA domain-containing protein [Holophagales bacterium]